MRKITLDGIEWEIECLPEDIPVRGNLVASGDDGQDKEDENRIVAELEWNPWAWCCVKVTGRWNGLEASDYLGCCSYKDETDFKQNGGYYEDMRGMVRSDLQKMAEWIAREVSE